MATKKVAAVLYHYPCHDGAMAALAAHLYFSAASQPVLFFPNTVYSPLMPHQLPLQEINHLYLLDFAGPPGFLHQISTKVENVTVLDHHKTTFESLDEDPRLGKNVKMVLDMERSGATIVHDYFKNKLMEEYPEDHGKMSEFGRMRRVFEYIEDGDLWRWKLPHSKAFHSGITDMKIEYDFNRNSSLFDQLLSLDSKSVIKRGTASLAQKQAVIGQVLEGSYEIALGGGELGRCLAVDADSIPELRSELGHQLAIKSKNLKLRGIGAVVYSVPGVEHQDELKISLRSLEDEDTTQISKKFGGGGHRNASSFLLNHKEFEQWKKVEENSEGRPVSCSRS